MVQVNSELECMRALQEMLSNRDKTSVASFGPLSARSSSAIELHLHRKGTGGLFDTNVSSKMTLLICAGSECLIEPWERMRITEGATLNQSITTLGGFAGSLVSMLTW